MIDTNWGKVSEFQVLLFYASISYRFVFTGCWSPIVGSLFSIMTTYKLIVKHEYNRLTSSMNMFKI